MEFPFPLLITGRHLAIWSLNCEWPYLASRNLTWQKFLSMFTEEHLLLIYSTTNSLFAICIWILGVWWETEQKPACLFFEKHSVINKNISYCSRWWLSFNLQSYIILLERIFATLQWWIIHPFFVPIGHTNHAPIILWFCDCSGVLPASDIIWWNIHARYEDSKQRRRLTRYTDKFTSWKFNLAGRFKL